MIRPLILLVLFASTASCAKSKTEAKDLSSAGKHISEVKLSHHANDSASTDVSANAAGIVAPAQPQPPATPVPSSSSSAASSGTATAAVNLSAVPLSPNAPSQLMLTAATNYGVGNCSAIVAGVLTAAGAPTYVTSPVLVSLATSTSSGTFYKDNSCTSSTKVLVIPTGTANAAVYYTENAAGSVAVTAAPGDGTKLSPATAYFTTSITSQLKFLGVGFTQASGAGCGGLVVQTQNAAGSAINQAKAVVLNVDSGSETGAFFSDAVCTNNIESVTIPAGMSQTPMFYYVDQADGTPTLSAQEQPSQNWLEAYIDVTIAN